MAIPSSQVPPLEPPRPGARAYDRPPPSSEFAEDGWQERLPVRLNPPPGWPTPSQDWILQHVGLEVSDASRPPGAPVVDPAGWLWWIPQEPAWSWWTARYYRTRRIARRITVAFFVFVGIALTTPVTGWAVGTVAIACAVSFGLSAIGLRANLRHFADDPFGALRRHSPEVSARFHEGQVLGDRPSPMLWELSGMDGGDGGGGFDV